MSEQAPKVEQEKKIYTGSCHCKAIQYEIRKALPEPPIATRCNCTICTKTGFTGFEVPIEDFIVKSPGSLEEIPFYQATSQKIYRRLCTKCGVSVYTHGEIEFDGKIVPFSSLNIATIDQPQEGFDLSKFKIHYWSGLDNGWLKHGKADTPYPGGCL